MKTRTRSIPFLLLLLCACSASPAGTGPTQSAIAPGVSPGSGTLYARDGSVVSASAQSGKEPEPKREIGDGEGSRVYLLELYQKSMDQKNALSVEVEGLRATLEEERKLATAATAEQERLRTELAQVTQERDGLRTQAFDLAARVTSAQIARLEAEKALLQFKIERQQGDDPSNAKKRNGSDRDPKSGGKRP
jgi:chromosome segregation ATPase